MSSNWEQFKSEQKAKTPEFPSKEIEGRYQCQTCNEFVRNATYYPTESALIYTCTSGHKSILENFRVSL